jgi:hypothetical protein
MREAAIAKRFILPHGKKITTGAGFGVEPHHLKCFSNMADSQFHCL